MGAVKRRAGFTLVEILVCISVLLVGILVSITAYSMSLKEATHTRERQLALLVAENLLERVRAHRYGAVHPLSWGEKNDPRTEEFTVVVDGRPVETKFTHYVAIGPEGNGSFFGDSKEAHDQIRVHVQWHEPLGATQWKSAELTLDTTVWRQHDTLLTP